EPQKLTAQILDRREAAVPEAPPLQNREEQLDLVDPRGMQRRIHELKLSAVTSVEPTPALTGTVQVNVQVVPDHDDAPGFPVLPGHLIHQRFQVSGSSPVAALGRYPAVGDVQRGQQRLRSMANVFVFVAAEPSGYGAAGFMFSFLGLNAGLFIDAQDDSVAGRVKVELNDGIRSEEHTSELQSR